jgi:uncharacterized membrane protein
LTDPRISVFSCSVFSSILQRSVQRPRRKFSGVRDLERREAGTEKTKIAFQGDAMPEETPQSPQSGLSDNAAGALSYITFIPAIIFLLVEPYNKSSYVRFHAWQCIFLSLAAFAVSAALALIPFLGWVLMPLVNLAFLILAITAILKASKGQRFKFPIVGDLAEKQAGA